MNVAYEMQIQTNSLIRKYPNYYGIISKLATFTPFENRRRLKRYETSLVSALSRSLDCARLSHSGVFIIFVTRYIAFKPNARLCVLDRSNDKAKSFGRYSNNFLKFLRPARNELFRAATSTTCPADNG